MNTDRHPLRTPMSPTRKAALIAGLAYIGTFVFSIPVKFGLWKDAIDDHDFVLGGGSDSGVPLGTLFEILTALTCVATAVALYGVAKRYDLRSALGFVTSRILEAGIILVGVFAVMSLYTLRNDPTGDPAAMSAVGRTLVATHDWAFLIGPGLMAPLNALLIGSVMYRSRLLPRWIPTLGLIGAPLLLTSFTVTLFGGWDQVSGPALALALPIAIWELSFGVYMTFKGFRRVPTDPHSAVADHVAPAHAAA